MTEEESVSGKQLGDFRLVREIGRGGMGTVYLAEQLSLRRTVALKVLNPGVSLNPTVVRRFQREAEAAGRLNHPFIVQVFSVGEEQNTHYFAMEYVDGESLDQIARRLRKGSKMDDLSTHPSVWSSQGFESGTGEGENDGDDRSRDEAREGESTDSTASETQEFILGAARLMAEVADALDYAHRHGIVHRDVKPHNILVDRSGRPYLVDFGLAQADGSMNITKTGEVFGTPTYMSPEQVAGSLGKIDHRTDIYSLGVSFYELLTLRRPFDGKSPQEIVRKILTAEPADPRKLNSRIPRDFSTIVLKCIEKDPDKRYRSAAELEMDLKHFLAGEPIKARPIGVVEKCYRYVARRRGPSAAVAAIVLLVGAMIYLGGKTSKASRGLSKAEGEAAANQAMMFLNDGKIDDAERMVLQGLEKDDSNPKFYLIRGKILRGRGRLDDAQVSFAEAAKYAPKDPTPLVESGHVFREKKDYERAMRFYKDAIGLDEKSAEAYDGVGECLTVLGDRAKANEYFETAEKMRRERFLPLVEEAIQLVQESKPVQAEEKCNLAIEGHSSLEEAYYWRAYARSKQGKLQKALDDVNQALDKNPRYAEAYFLRAELSIGSGFNDPEKQDKVQKDLQRAIRFAESAQKLGLASLAHFRLGQISFEQLDWSGALAHFELAAQQDPKNLKAGLFKAFTFFELGDWSKAEKEFVALSQIESLESLAAQLGLALLHEKKGNSSKALEILTRANEKNKDQAPLLYHEARIGLAYRNDARDRLLLDRAVELQPRNAEFRLVRFRARSAEKNAEEDFVTALDLDPQFTAENFFDVVRNNFSKMVSIRSLAKWVQPLTPDLAAPAFLSERPFELLQDTQKFLPPHWRDPGRQADSSCGTMEIRRLLGDLRSTASKVRENAEKGLMDCGWESIVALREELNSPDVEPSIVTLLEKLERARAIEERATVYSWLLKSDPRLTQIGKETGPYLVQLLRDLESRELRWLALRALIQAQDPEIEGPLVGLLEHKEPIVRYYALRALTQLKKTVPVEKLVELLRDKNASVRLAALLAVSNVQYPLSSVRELIKDALSESMALLRWVSARVIGDRGERSLAPFLRKALQTEVDPDVRSQMFHSLYQIGDEVATLGFGIATLGRTPVLSSGAADTFMKILQRSEDPNLNQREEEVVLEQVLEGSPDLVLIYYAKRWGLEREYRHLHRLLLMKDSNSPFVRAVACWALVRLGVMDPLTVESLLNTGSPESAFLRQLVSIGALTGPEDPTLTAIVNKLHELKRYPELLQFAKLADQRFPNQPGWVLHRFFAQRELLQGQRDMGPAQELIEEAVKRFPKEALVLSRAADFYVQEHKQKDLKRAVELAQQSLRIEPSPEVYLILSAAQTSLGNWIEASEAAKKGLQHPKSGQSEYRSTVEALKGAQQRADQKLKSP